MKRYIKIIANIIFTPYIKMFVLSIVWVFMLWLEMTGITELFVYEYKDSIEVARVVPVVSAFLISLMIGIINLYFIIRRHYLIYRVMFFKHLFNRK